LIFDAAQNSTRWIVSPCRCDDAMSSSHDLHAEPIFIGVF
jgi:hypothetical protein